MAKPETKKTAKKTLPKKEDEKMNENTEERKEVEPVQLTLQDMQAISQILDVATRRGAFQAKELTAVGAVYDKLTGFLDYIASTQEDNDEEESEE